MQRKCEQLAKFRKGLELTANDFVVASLSDESAVGLGVRFRTLELVFRVLGQATGYLVGALWFRHFAERSIFHLITGAVQYTFDNLSLLRFKI